MKDINDETDDMIREFAERHDLESGPQFNMLAAEVGELGEALLTGDYESIEEEIGDVVFVVRMLAYLEGVDYEQAVHHIADENLDKDASKDGGKVTKDGLE